MMGTLMYGWTLLDLLCEEGTPMGLYFGPPLLVKYTVWPLTEMVTVIREQSADLLMEEERGRVSGRCPHQGGGHVL